MTILRSRKALEFLCKDLPPINHVNRYPYSSKNQAIYLVKDQGGYGLVTFKTPFHRLFYNGPKNISKIYAIETAKDFKKCIVGDLIFSNCAFDNMSSSLGLQTRDNWTIWLDTIKKENFIDPTKFLKQNLSSDTYSSDIYKSWVIGRLTKVYQRGITKGQIKVITSGFAYYFNSTGSAEMVMNLPTGKEELEIIRRLSNFSKNPESFKGEIKIDKIRKSLISAKFKETANTQ